MNSVLRNNRGDIEHSNIRLTIKKKKKKNTQQQQQYFTLQ